MGLKDPLFEAAWPQAVETLRVVNRERAVDRARRARSGELGVFAKVMQQEMDEWAEYARKELNRCAYG